jgi:hypothetical protein
MVFKEELPGDFSDGLTLPILAVNVEIEGNF